MPKTKICKYCEKEFVDKHRDGKQFCDRRCFADYRRGKSLSRNSKPGKSNPNWRGGNEKICEYCGKTYTDNDYNKDRRFCSRDCYGMWRHESRTVFVKCKTCGIEFQIHFHDLGKITHCSPVCAARDPERLMRIRGKKRNIAFSKEGIASIRKSLLRRMGTMYTQSKRGYHTSKKAGRVWYRSSYEKKAYEILDDNNDFVSYSVEPTHIEYMLYGKKHWYFPDILAVRRDGSMVLIEVKAKWGVNEKKFMVKERSAKRWCCKRGYDYMLWTEEFLFGGEQ